MQVIKWNGKPIKKPGWYSGITLEQYHSAGICDGLAVSSSDLRTCWQQSPRHMQAKWAENPKRIQKKTPKHFALGSAAHFVLLGEDFFWSKYVRTPLTYRDKKTAKEKPWHNGADFCKRWNEKQAKAGRTPVTTDILQTILAMSQSLNADTTVREGLLRGYVEVSGFAKDPETGLWIKVRPDVIPTFTGEFADLKTAADVTDVALQSSIRSFGYHMQGALIWEVAELLQHPFESFTLMFIESDEPYCARAVPLEDEDLAFGRRMNRAMRRKIAACIEADYFYGPGGGDLRALPLSTAERERIEKRLGFEGV